ncbi:MAG: hypothetical protein ACTHLE_21850 [Agriterribacter sp.]
MIRHQPVENNINRTEKRQEPWARSHVVRTDFNPSEKNAQNKKLHFAGIACIYIKNTRFHIYRFTYIPHRRCEGLPLRETYHVPLNPKKALIKGKKTGWKLWQQKKFP